LPVGPNITERRKDDQSDWPAGQTARELRALSNFITTNSNDGRIGGVGVGPPGVKLGLINNMRIL
jgi:hypothetical protein